MEFVVDKVSEDSFYENLLIGLPKILEKLPNVSDVQLERSPAVPHNTICTWEQKNGVLLPEDLRNFYGSVNGLLYCYNFYYSESQLEEDKISGKIEVNGLNELVQIYGYEINSEPAIHKEGEYGELRLGPDSKVFELVNIYDVGRVTLVYLNHKYLPSIWVHNSEMKFSFLADTFTTYLRMCIHHLGIPYWQCAFTEEGLPENSEMVFRLLAPATLHLHKRSAHRKRHSLEKTDLINKIDSNIFRTVRAPQFNTVNVSNNGVMINDTKKKATKSKFPIKSSKRSANLKR